ncbi:MAG TPA: hypothetical protein VF796_22880 [Humisphaera sp.]
MRLQAVRILVAVALVSPVAACAAAAEAPPATRPTTGPSDRLVKHLGRETVDVLSRADRGEAFRVGTVDPEKAGTDATVGGRLLPADAKPVPLPKEAFERLRTALLSDDAYFRADSKGTKTGVGYRLRTPAGETVEVSYCVAKGNVWVVTKDASGKVLAKGDRRGFRDDKASPLRTIAAELFPADADVQAYRPK